MKLLLLSICLSYILICSCSIRKETDMVKTTYYKANYSSEPDSLRPENVVITKYTSDLDNHRKSIYYGDDQIDHFSYDYYGKSEHLFAEFSSNNETDPVRKTYSFTHFMREEVTQRAYYIMYSDLRYDNSYAEVSYTSDTLEYGRTFKITRSVIDHYKNWIDAFSDSTDVFSTPEIPDLSGCTELISSSYKKTVFLNPDHTDYRLIYVDSLVQDTLRVSTTRMDFSHRLHTNGDSILRSYRIKRSSTDQPTVCKYVDTLYIKSVPVRVRNYEIDSVGSDTLLWFEHTITHLNNKTLERYYIHDPNPDTSDAFNIYATPLTDRDIRIWTDRKGRITQAQARAVTHDGIVLESWIVWDKTGQPEAKSSKTNYKGKNVNLYYPYANLNADVWKIKPVKRLKAHNPFSGSKLVTRNRRKNYEKRIVTDTYQTIQYEIYYKE